MLKINKILDLPFISHPLTIATLILLIINDNYLKQMYGNAITGKISDFCGLYFFPLFLLASVTIIIRIVRSKNNYEPSWPHLLIIIIITYSFFAGIQLSEHLARFYESLLHPLGFPAKVTRDLTDLIAFISIVPLYIFNRNLGAK